ncbi:MAG: 2Fe-2S iron-sulfur cluster-binding protein [Dehalococcoidia bacterium]|nr:2Fe-2S iron-sulfur cluster-binding protein [Dehalococcoidia bacterium]
MVKLTIDNKEIQVEDGASILDAAAKTGISIPTLCHNEELSPAGACRVCTVEVATDEGPITVASCNYPVADGMVVNTKSEMALKARKLALEMLLAQSPQSEKIAKLALDAGLDAPRFSLKGDECVLCRLCVRTCQEVVGANAITFIAQGLDRDNKDACVEWDADKCIACGSCAFICPTKAVTLCDNVDTRVIQTPNTNMEFKMKACTKCGAYYAPEKQLEYMAKTAKLPIEKFDLCMDCRD